MIREFESKYNSIIEAVYNHSKNTPNKMCLTDKNKELSYINFWNEIKQISNLLKNKGINKGDCILVECNQSIEYCILGFAIQLLGGIFVPIELNSADETIVKIKKSTNSVLLISKSKKSDNNSITYKDIFNSNSITNIDYEVEFPKLNDYAEILFTTGTTGQSKGILLSHKNNVAVAQNVIYGVEMKKDNVEIIPITLSHSHGLRTYYANMLNGSSVILMDGVINIKKIFNYLDNNATSIDLTPSALQILLKLSKDKLSNYNDKLDYIQLGSAKLTDSDKNTLRELLPNVRLYDFHGSTEAGCSCIINFNKDFDKLNSIGKPSFNSDFVVLDPDNPNIVLESNEKGLLATGGHMKMITYWKQGDLANSITYNDYILSSDLAYKDEEGYIYVLGRIDYVISYGGIKISPDEIESVLIRYPNIKDCACVGIDNDISGQVPAILYVKKDINFDLNNFVEFVNKNIDSNKLPKAYMEVNEIPRASNGKILRNKLKDLYV